MSIPAVCFHDGDNDGFTAAWVVSRQHPDFKDNSNVEFYQVSYGTPIPIMPENAIVVIVDFSYDRDTMIALIENNQRVEIYDHHLSSQALETLRDVYLPHRYMLYHDEQRSACGLAWDVITDGAERPRLVDLVEDRDLWRKALAGSMDFNEGLASLSHQFGEWDWASSQSGLEWLTLKGRHALELKIQKAQEYIDASLKEVTINGISCLIAIGEGRFSSELSELLYVQYPDRIVGCCWQRPRGDVRFRLSSAKESGLDCAELAESMDGGGHFHASGFVVSKDHELAREFFR